MVTPPIHWRPAHVIGLLRFFVLRSGFRPESSLALCPEVLRSPWPFLLIGPPCALSFLPCASKSAPPSGLLLPYA